MSLLLEIGDKNGKLPFLIEYLAKRAHQSGIFCHHTHPFMRVSFMVSKKGVQIKGVHMPLPLLLQIGSR